MVRIIAGRITPLLAAERGVAAIEYGIIVALISLAGVAAIPGLSQSLNSTLETVSEALQGYFEDGEEDPGAPGSPSSGEEAAEESPAGAEEGGKKGKKPKKPKKPKKD